MKYWFDARKVVWMRVVSWARVYGREVGQIITEIITNDMQVVRLHGNHLGRILESMAAE